MSKILPKTLASSLPCGPEVERIFETLTGTGEDKDYDLMVTKLTAYFSPKKNMLYEIHVFQQARQRPNETIDQFYTRLRQLAQTCEFADSDKEIKLSSNVFRVE